MRYVLCLLATLVLAGASSAPSLNGPGIVRVNAETLYTKRLSGGNTLQVALIYNPRITPRAIGSALTICKYIGRNGPLGAGTRYCFATYSLPHGRISTTGLIKTRSYYVFSVVGGTGLYSNVGGEVVVSTYAYPPRQERLLFSLEVIS